jgi:hypothetical protein
MVMALGKVSWEISAISLRRWRVWTGPFRAEAAGEGEDLADDLSAAVGAGLHGIEEVEALGVGDAKPDDREREENGGEDIVEIVGDATGEDAEAFKALGSEELFFELFALGDVEVEGEDGLGGALVVSDGSETCVNGDRGALFGDVVLLGLPRIFGLRGFFDGLLEGEFASEELGSGFADGFVGGPPVEALGAAVPVADDAVEAPDDDGFVGEVDDVGLIADAVFGGALCGDVGEGHDDAPGAALGVGHAGADVGGDPGDCAVGAVQTEDVAILWLAGADTAEEGLFVLGEGGAVGARGVPDGEVGAVIEDAGARGGENLCGAVVAGDDRHGFDVDEDDAFGEGADHGAVALFAEAEGLFDALSLGDLFDLVVEGALEAVGEFFELLDFFFELMDEAFVVAFEVGVFVGDGGEWGGRRLGHGVDELAKRGREDIGVEGLDEVARGSELVGELHVGFFGVAARVEDERDALPLGGLVDFAAELEAIHAGHEDVGDDQVDLLLGQSFQAFDAVACREGFESRRAQDHIQKIGVLFFVVDNEGFHSGSVG